MNRRERIAAIGDAFEYAEVRYVAAAEALWVAIYSQELALQGIHSPTVQEAAQAARMGLASAIWGPAP